MSNYQRYNFAVLLGTGLSFLLLGFGSTRAQGIRSKVNKGNQFYQKKKYEQALSQYKDALLDDPLNEVALFNQADALYKMKKYDQAIENYQKVVGSKDLKLSAKAFYNIGNAYFKQNKLQESIKAYKKALELNPGDYETKFNLELARARLKELSKKQPRNRKNQNKNQKPIKPSEWAKKLKEQAEQLVARKKYKDAYNLMMDGMKKDNTVRAFESFIRRIKDVVDIVEAHDAV